MTNHDEFSLAVKAFIGKRHQERYLGFLRKPKNRTWFRESLNVRFYMELKQQFVIKAPDKPAEIAAKLKSLGAPEMALVCCSGIDPDSELQWTLLDALLSVVDYSGGGCLISCIPGQLYYYQDEFSKYKYILHKKI